MSGSSSSSIRAEDRLFHLTLALLATRDGLSKEQILQTVRGYREDAEAGAARDTLERRFERDKDLMRELGIPLETWIPADEDGNNRSTLYRISKGRFEHPPSLGLSATDIGLLNLAAAVWRQGSLSHEARVAQLKIASHGTTVDEPLLGHAPLLTARDPALRQLRKALAERLQVRFLYLKPGEGKATSRVVSPLAVVMHEGRWHLLSLEGEHALERTFLLRRIVSEVEIVDVPAVRLQANQVKTMTEELEALYRQQHAVIDVQPGTHAETVLLNREGTTRQGNALVVHYTDEDVFAEGLCEHGPEIRVVSPPSLREKVAANWRKVLADHG